MKISARHILGLVLATLAGFGAYALKMPLPWMMGPMLVMAALSIARAPIAGPGRIRPFVIPILGVMMGSRVTVEMFGQIGDWALAVIGLVPVLIVSAWIGYVIYRKTLKMDPVTAFFSAMPGGLNEMFVLGAAAGGDDRQIALAHATRIMMTVSLIALLFGAIYGVSTSNSGGSNWVALDVPSVLDYALLAACAVLGRTVARLLHLPAPDLMGPMVLSGAAHMIGWVQVPPPTVLVNGAQIIMGATIGARFLGLPARAVLRAMVPSAIVAMIMIGTTYLFALGLTQITDIPPPQAFLGYAAGGVTEMSLLALAMDEEVAYVSTLHILRIVLIIAVAQPIFLGLRRYLVRA
ncbi:AbrB family transcriptional regulator [Ketogulonicigenium vulgare]|uniref:Putative ammonia monooxygenase superfamily protein n=1 Tax=Ketogulonicigenium vulgare (strain WSH-001) TaxID=759362 RepID=F9Y6Q5_KETVW|nr:AbrB family transcriptional regulator [Ketogulonicigenium vulgare]AEM42175.1 putative ammonia monooxygenase superfamily protein [Ketogulonicigenium vulgare WSH-001]ALJ79801.1 ammonia monooxygenase [Ketogulonicigenium vulgare]ANW32716.1 ammonia monooxygenase [Ketogulonicigenium vulgare]AOZ55955.1 putative ammonia monooxygenase superfamily protein [Ketogulonicigenium vulgare]